MPPTRGHDLKLVVLGINLLHDRMPPTRGHDLKPLLSVLRLRAAAMPPTRGHDLKLYADLLALGNDAMPPTRGHDLKHSGSSQRTPKPEDAPHTGARLETMKANWQIYPTARCPPHGGTT